MRLYYLLFALTINLMMLNGCKSPLTVENESSGRTGEFLGETLPGNEPLLFAEGVISTGFNDRDFTLSPDGTRLFFSRTSPKYDFSTIMIVRREEEIWKEPEIASFSGIHPDLEPAFLPDGTKLFFVSARPVNPADTIEDFDIWYVEKTENGWSEPVNPGSPVNTEQNEFYPSLTDKGTLYYTTHRKDSRGGEDIYFSMFVDGRYQEPVNLGDAVNSSRGEFNAFIAPDESFLIFGTFGRRDGLGGGDLYISWNKGSGKWTEAQHMGNKINSGNLDYCPFVTGDNRFLFYTSERIIKREYESPMDILDYHNMISLPGNGLGDIYWVRFDTTRFHEQDL